MEFISPDRTVAGSTQIRSAVQPFQVSPARVNVSILLLNEFLEGLG
jgi:hypothetical protein